MNNTIGWAGRKDFFFSYNMIFEMPLTEHAKFAYLYLCRCANGDGKSFPSYATIAINMSVSRPTAMRAIKELMAIGLLEVKAQYRGKEQTSNLYLVHTEPARIEEFLNKKKEGGSISQIPPKKNKKDKGGSISQIPPSISQIPPQYHTDTLSTTNISTTNISTTDGLKNTISAEKIMDKIGYEKNKNTHGEIVDEIVNCVYEVLNVKEMKIDKKILGIEMRRKIVMQITPKHIETIVKKIKSNTTNIKNKKAWLQSVIYNAMFENELTGIVEKSCAGNNKEKVKSISTNNKNDMYKQYSQRTYTQDYFDGLYKEL